VLFAAHLPGHANHCLALLNVAHAADGDDTCVKKSGECRGLSCRLPARTEGHAAVPGTLVTFGGKNNDAKRRRHDVPKVTYMTRWCHFSVGFIMRSLMEG
jgi:hypothetical protein